MDRQDAIYQKICQFIHTSYEPSKTGETSREIDDEIRELLEEEYHGKFEHAEDRCLECQYEVKLVDELRRNRRE